jgi:hypothetical protein
MVLFLEHAEAKVFHIMNFVLISSTNAPSTDKVVFLASGVLLNMASDPACHLIFFAEEVKLLQTCQAFEY